MLKRLGLTDQWFGHHVELTILAPTFPNMVTHPKNLEGSWWTFSHQIFRMYHINIDLSMMLFCFYYRKKFFWHCNSHFSRPALWGPNMTCILGARENIPGFFFPKVIIFFKKSTNLMLITRPFPLYWVLMRYLAQFLLHDRLLFELPQKSGQ